MFKAIAVQNESKFAISPPLFEGGEDFTNGLEDPPLIPLFQRGRSKFPFATGDFVKMLSKENIDFGQEWFRAFV
jgi:hypothetical protein